MKTKLPEFCRCCGCRDYEDKYYLHVEDGRVYCRSSNYEGKDYDDNEYKHSCYLFRENSLKMLMLKRKYGLEKAMMFYRGEE